MFASITDLGNITVYLLLMFLFAVFCGVEIPVSMIVCHVVVIVAGLVVAN